MGTTKVNVKRESKNKIVPVDIDSQTEIKTPNKGTTSMGTTKGNIIMNDGIIVNPFKSKNACVEISVDNLSKDSPTKKTENIDKKTLNLPKRKIVTWLFIKDIQKNAF